jgi:hypothetical protein
VTSNQDAINYFRDDRRRALRLSAARGVVPRSTPRRASQGAFGGTRQIWMISRPTPTTPPFSRCESFAAADLTPAAPRRGRGPPWPRWRACPTSCSGADSPLPESGEAKKSGESALVQKLARIQVSLGEDWEIVMRTALRAMGDERAGTLRAETRWRSTETRNEAVRTDSVVKQFSAGLIDSETAREQLGYSVEQIARMRDRDVERQARDPQARMAELVEAVGGGEQARALSRPSPA